MRLLRSWSIILQTTPSYAVSPLTHPTSLNLATLLCSPH
ncbi:hypothetical protein PSPO01_01463 [Paraphaeosphaeria sporulosa]